MMIHDGVDVWDAEWDDLLEGVTLEDIPKVEVEVEVEVEVDDV